MKKETPRQQFKRLVIMGNYPGLTYEEALEKDFEVYKSKLADYLYTLALDRDYKERIEKKDINSYWVNEITTGRVMQALHDEWTGRHDMHISRAEGGSVTMYCGDPDVEFTWQLTKDGVECTDDDQTDETINSLIKLLQQ